METERGILELHLGKAPEKRREVPQPNLNLPAPAQNLRRRPRPSPAAVVALIGFTPLHSLSPTTQNTTHFPVRCGAPPHTHMHLQTVSVSRQSGDIGVSKKRISQEACLAAISSFSTPRYPITYMFVSRSVVTGLMSAFANCDQASQSPRTILPPDSPLPRWCLLRAFCVPPARPPRLQSAQPTAQTSLPRLSGCGSQNRLRLSAEFGTGLASLESPLSSFVLFPMGNTLARRRPRFHPFHLTGRAPHTSEGRRRAYKPAQRGRILITPRGLRTITATDHGYGRVVGLRSEGFFLPSLAFHDGATTTKG
ncbi:hypothetical protein CKAH01_10867 [Colletotrichum kahawae]|uniref:Uncharacterized protein n=1 Tax=Colletotrichum kahawae TaxID=34407 RepID=A0AAD9XXE1_COLKA|nr:hypothetical protein CKAH01_10867 [Colletotrichum kahawae]